MRALYQPPTLGTINISALTDTHCMWASLALTPTAERNNELLKNMKQQREGGRARASLKLTNFIQQSSYWSWLYFLAGQSEGCSSVSEVCPLPAEFAPMFHCCGPIVPFAAVYQLEHCPPLYEPTSCQDEVNKAFHVFTHFTTVSGHAEVQWSALTTVQLQSQL